MWIFRIQIISLITWNCLEAHGKVDPTQRNGYAVEYSSPSNFFVKAFDAVTVDNLLKVTSSLQNLYSNPSNIKKGYTPDTGEVCVAKYHQDQQWYRALVYNLESTMRTAQVLYLDYGNLETVSLDSVQPMHRDVELLPPCALHCCVAHVTAPPYGWSTECLVEVKSRLVGQKLLIRIIDVVQGELPRYTVDVSLLDSGEHIHTIMIQKGYSFPPLNKKHGKGEDPETGGMDIQEPRLMKQTEMSDTMQGDNAAPKPEVLSSSLPVGSRFETLITVIHDPEMFFCQQVQNAKQLSEVMIMMHERYSALPASPGFLPSRGEICAAQFTEDDNWYRASVVRQVADESVLVGYLDFGNTETLPISRVRRIEPELLSLPFQAAQCCLAGVKPPSGKWTSEATDAFKVLVMNKILTASVVTDCNRVLTLELTDESVTPKISISQNLIEAGLAVPYTSDCETPAEEGRPPEDRAAQLRWTELPPGQVSEVLVCMLQNPGEFFCHLYNQTELLNKLNISLGQYCTQHKSEEYYPAKEEICGAYYAGDGSWYRVQVKDFTPDSVVKILFLDYGNVEDVSVDKLCKIPSSFLELPFQAICCSLSGIKPAGEKWSADSAKTFQKSVVGLKLLAKAAGRTKNGYSIELVAADSGAVIADELLATKDAVRDEKLVKEEILINNTRALRPPNYPSLSSKMLPVWNSDKGELMHKELSPRDCGSAPSIQLRPLESIPSILRDAHAAIPKLLAKNLSSPTAVPRDLIADPPGGREAHSSNVIQFALNDVRYPKSIPSTAMDPTASTHRAPLFKTSSTLSPTESHGPKSSSPFLKDARNPNLLAPRGGHSPRSMEFSSSRAPAPVSRDLHPRNLLPSFPKEMLQAKSIPTSSRESHFTNSTKLTPSNPHVNIEESRSCVSPPGHLQSTPPVDSCKQNSHHSTLSNSKHFQFSNFSPTALSKSTSSAERGPHPDLSPLSNKSLHGEMQNVDDKSASCHSAASQDLSGVSFAQTWISVDLPLNKAIPACVLKVISPDLFYVFPKENRVDVKKLHQVMMEIFEHCSKETSEHHYRPSVGDACCAKFTEDGQWYRAVVLEVQDSSAKIAYADYGNMEVLPFSCLLPMTPRFLELPMQLTKCSLADVVPVTEPWPPDAAHTLTSVLLGSEVLITAKSLNAGIYSASVDKQQDNGVLHVAEALVVEGLARRVTLTPVTITCSEGGRCCCRDLLKRVEKLEEMILHLLNVEKYK
ncbi:tudor domain-containing protein 1 [Rhinoderma darwinii]|uniref:tudor domain-containing protein 1 n=1 Tax=Rhinoderma darwinii TaxID=43563 RepID=UPI003F668EE6